MDRTRRRREPVAQAFSQDLATQLEAGVVRTGAPEGAYSLFAPQHYEPGYAYPLIVWLHGSHSDERQLLRVMPMISLRNYVAVSPRGTIDGDGAGAGHGWLQSDEHISQAEHRVFEAIRTATARMHVAPHRVFLAGFDCGGTMAYRVAMNHPRVFAGVLSLCGAFPSGGMPFRNLADARRLAIFLAVGRRGLAYPADDVCRDLRLFHAAGLSVTLRDYPCGHELTPQMLSDVDRWIIEQITVGAAPEARNSWLSCEMD